jgi:hypothetical protein
MKSRHRVSQVVSSTYWSQGPGARPARDPARPQTRSVRKGRVFQGADLRFDRAWRFCIPLTSGEEMPVLFDFHHVQE